MITTLHVANRAEMREAYEAWARGVALETGVQSFIESMPEMDAEIRDNHTLLLWMNWAGHRLEVTAPLIAFLDGRGETQQ
jgi:hypothetical protein